MYEAKKDDRLAYINVYIPFRTSLEKIKKNEGNICKPEEVETKLLTRPVQNTVDNFIHFYSLYNIDKANQSSKQVLSLINEFKKKTNKYIATKKIKKFREVNILNVSFSIYDDSANDSKNKLSLNKNILKKIGFLKVLIGISFDENANEEAKIEAIRQTYDVMSRNLKTKENPPINLQFGFSYDKLTKYFNTLVIDFYKGKTSRLCMTQEDWFFNYKRKDARSYTFSFIIEKTNINNYKNTDCNYYLYSLSRIHEPGTIRTYYKKNDIIDIYRDDTSVMWGFSKVGIGAICAQKTEKEIIRNINVLNNDFSLIYEFCLHQKFFNYLLIDYDDITNANRKKEGLKHFITRSFVNNYLSRKEFNYFFIEKFCPKIISEFETQDIYCLIKNKIRTDDIMLDSENSLKSLEAAIKQKKAKRNIVISATVSIFGFPVAFLQFYKVLMEPNFSSLFILLLMIGGLFVWMLYSLAGREK